MEFIIANLDLIVTILAVVFATVYKVFKFVKHPSKKRQELILLWLIEAVAVAEEKYGNGTGVIKLSYVYKMFVDKFGVFGMFVSQELFESLVKKALKEMQITFKNKLENDLNNLPKE